MPRYTYRFRSLTISILLSMLAAAMWPHIPSVIFPAQASANSSRVNADPAQDWGSQGEGEAKSITLPLMRKPPLMSREEQAQLQRAAEQAQAHPPALPQVELPGAPRASNDLPTEAASTVPQAPNDFVVPMTKDFSATEIPTARRELPHSPSVATAGNVVFYTGSSYAAISSDGGRTFSFVDPNRFPRAAGGFCGGQQVVYSPEYDLFIWRLYYCADTTNDLVRLAFASKSQAVAGNWRYYDFKPQDFNFAAGRFQNLGEMVLSATHVFSSSNVFRIADRGYERGLMLRVRLSDLAAGRLFWNGFAPAAEAFSLVCATGIRTTEMYFAALLNTTKIRIFNWPDARDFNGITFNDVTLTTAFTRISGDAVATSPDGTNWARYAPEYIVAGWMREANMTRSGELGFTWCARQDTARGRPYPYTILARFNPANRQLIAQHEVSNTTFAWLYPAVAVNRSDNLALVAGYGGGSLYPSTAAVIFDELLTNYASFNFPLLLARSDAGPRNNFWGYFLTVRPHADAPNSFVAATYYLNGGGAAANVVPRYVRFGRERDFLECGLSAITAGQTVNGSLTNTDCLSLAHRGVAPGAPFTRADRYSFNGTSGQRIALRLKPTGISTYLTLFGPDETLLAESDYEEPGVEVRIPETSGFLTLPATGRYVIEVAGYDPADTGAYTLNLAAEVATAAHVSAASFTGALAAEAIAAAFGSNLATGIAIADTLPLPTSLLGTMVKVRDSQGVERPSPLFFVAPGQINYLIPAGTVPGAATFTISINGNAVAPSHGAGQRGRARPVFGQRFRARRHFGRRSACDGQRRANLRTHLPLRRGAEPLRRRPARSGTERRSSFPDPLRHRAARAQLAGGGFGQTRRLDLPLLYAGAQGSFAGLDQINLGPLPRALAGRGVVDLIVTLDGKTSNVVQVQIK